MYIAQRLSPHLTYFFLEHDNAEDLLWLKRNYREKYNAVQEKDVSRVGTTTLVLENCEIKRFMQQLFKKI